MSNNDPLNIFWTGGWDSTFHLLDLVTTRELKVQPHYIIDEDRRSLQAEIGAIRKLKQLTFKLNPQASELILPTLFTAKSDLIIDQATHDAFSRVKAGFSSLGTQYAWLTQYCIDHEIDNMRVCIEKSISFNDAGPVHIEKLLWDESEQVDDLGKAAFKAKRVAGNEAFFYMFGRYLLPLLDTTKPEMMKMAEQRGWSKIMAKTWFCHWPTRRGKPCGRCNPCLFVASEGMAWRLPLGARIKSIFSKGY